MQRPKLSQDQRGVVSIIVSILIMIVISLVAIAFARMMRREQVQALDRQLSLQAYYAAESATNDAREALYTGQILDKEDCVNNSGPLSESSINSEFGVQYTCVTIDSAPNSLEYEGVGVNRSVVSEVKAVNDAGDPARIQNLKLSWEDPGGSTNYAPTSLTLPPASGWGNRPGALRVQIIPIPNTSFNRNYLITNSKHYVFYPTTNGGSVAWSNASANGQIIGGRCSASNSPRDCSVEITGLPLDSGGRYIVRMLSIYRPVAVTVTATLPTSGQASFTGAQMVVDATGKANDVLRRIQERIPLKLAYDYPEFALDIGDDLCKRLEAEPGRVSVEASAASVPACQL